MNCRDMQTQAVCLRAADGSKVSALAHFEYGLDAEAVMLNASTRFTDVTGAPLDTSLFEEVTIGACPTDVKCVESQEYTYGIDNTGTNFRWADATYEIRLSDGSSFQFKQSAAANGGWTPQMQEWGQNIQAAADAAGLLWFVETRFRAPSDPSNLAGGGGFSGPPSLAVSEALTSMLWRYVNIQICPGQPVPVEANLIAVDDPNGAVVPELPRALTTDGAVLGPIQKFWICAECGKEPVWYLEDAVTLAESGQIPNCWEPCGTLTLTEGPPDRECQFFFATACDNQNDPDPTSWIQDITRRTTVCNGETIDISYFQADPGDPTALLDYELLGAFVDCASGQPIEDEAPECRDYEYIGDKYYLTLAGPPSTLVEWWADPAGPIAGTGVAHGNVSDIFTNTGETLEHASGPADRSYVSPEFSVEGTNAGDFISGMGLAGTADSSGTDQGKLSAYFFLPKAAQLRDGGTRTGERGGLWLNRCCSGDLELLEERTVDTTAAERGVFNGTVIPAGIHYAEAAISDLSAWWNLTLEASFDNGETYGPLLGYLDKPKLECIPVVMCLDSGLFLNAYTKEILDPERLLCNDPCVDNCCSESTEPGGSNEGPTAQEIAAAMVTEQRSRVEGRMESWVNETDTQQLDVPPGTMGCLRSITDYGPGAVYWTIDGTVPSATNGSLMSVQYGNNIDLCGIDLSLVRLNASSTGSDYSVTYEIWT